MQPLVAVLHIFISATLSGVAVVAALLMGATSLSAFLGAAVLGIVVAIPVSFMIAKRLENLN